MNNIGNTANGQKTIRLNGTVYREEVPPDSTGYLFILLFFFQPSFFLWIKLGLFLLFPSAFILFSLITHICFSLHENDLRRTVAQNVLFHTIPGNISIILNYTSMLHRVFCL